MSEQDKQPRLREGDVREVPADVARTHRSYEQFEDPMLRAAAASGSIPGGSDAMRWLGYADQELQRLREAVGLPTRPSYACGRPNYEDPR